MLKTGCWLSKNLKKVMNILAANISTLIPAAGPQVNWLKNSSSIIFFYQGRRKIFSYKRNLLLSFFIMLVMLFDMVDVMIFISDRDIPKIYIGIVYCLR